MLQPKHVLVKRKFFMKHIIKKFTVTRNTQWANRASADVITVCLFIVLGGVGASTGGLGPFVVLGAIGCRLLF